MSEEKSEGASKIDTYCGLLIAVFAAVLAITDLGAGRYGDDEKAAISLGSEKYSWFQSKSIKQTLKEENARFLQSLLDAKVIESAKEDVVIARVEKLNKDVAKYEKEKMEILKGSAQVGKENWVQEENGKLGAIIGAEEYKAMADKLGDAGDYFDIATLFLQLCLVLGAISLITTPVNKKKFLYGMIFLGLVGAGFTKYAFYLAMA